MIKVKNHQIPPTIRVDRALGISSEPGATHGRRRVNDRSKTELEWFHKKNATKRLYCLQDSRQNSC